MNKVILIGRLVANPELRHTQSDKAVATYRLAVDRPFKREGQQEADFLTCVAWGKNAEFASKYLQKGTKIAIEGRIQTRNYKKDDGTTVYATEIIVEHHEFCESRKNTSSGGDYGGQSYDGGYESGNAFSELDEDDGDLPF